MKILVAIDPVETKGKTFEGFCEAVALFQEKGLFSAAMIASMMHASLYSVPTSWYREMKGKYARETQDRIESACEGRFTFQAARVLLSGSSSNQDLVMQLSRFGRRKGCELLVVGSNNRTGLPHWILGSFAETAALTATLPVFVVKPHWSESPYSREMRCLVAIDANAPPSARQVHWIARAVKPSNARIDLVYVRPRHRMVTDAVRPPQQRDNEPSVLKNIQRSLRSEGIHAETHLIDETKSLAHALSEFADNQKTWLTIAMNVKRSLPHRLLLGSTARRLLSLTERPFICLAPIS